MCLLRTALRRNPSSGRESQQLPDYQFGAGQQRLYQRSSSASEGNDCQNTLEVRGRPVVLRSGVGSAGLALSGREQVEYAGHPHNSGGAWFGARRSPIVVALERYDEAATVEGTNKVDDAQQDDGHVCFPV